MDQPRKRKQELCMYRKVEGRDWKRRIGLGGGGKTGKERIQGGTAKI